MPMNIPLETIRLVAVALLASALISFGATPVVKNLAFRVGAVDVPKDGRRMHDHPIPRMGGLAIVLGYLFGTLIFVPLTQEVQGMLLGGVIIAILGVFDDIYDLPAKLKLAVQIVAALVAVLSGNVIEVLSNPNVFSADPYWELGPLAIPVTVIWIVAITNAVNLIDGLDGLACGVSTISSMTMLVIALLVAEQSVAISMAALAGACIGFLPYNLNPAKIFMGDTGATFLGFILATMSVQGMFKVYTIISFLAPFLMLGFPIFDTAFAFIRRILKGQSPMSPDRGHVHHRLMDMGLTQKQAVGVLYVISAILGLSAVVLTTSGAVRAVIFLLTMAAAGAVAWKVYLNNVAEHHRREQMEREQKEREQSEREAGDAAPARREEPRPEWQEDEHE